MHAEPMCQITAMQMEAADGNLFQSHIQFVGGTIGMTPLQSNYYPLILFIISRKLPATHNMQL